MNKAKPLWGGTSVKQVAKLCKPKTRVDSQINGARGVLNPKLMRGGGIGHLTIMGKSLKIRWLITQPHRKHKSYEL